MDENNQKIIKCETSTIFYVWKVNNNKFSGLNIHKKIYEKKIEEEKWIF